jgi:hypothetical protein
MLPSLITVHMPEKNDIWFIYSVYILDERGSFVNWKKEKGIDISATQCLKRPLHRRFCGHGRKGRKKCAKKRPTIGRAEATLGRVLHHRFKACSIKGNIGKYFKRV